MAGSGPSASLGMTVRALGLTVLGLGMTENELGMDGVSALLPAPHRGTGSSPARRSGVAERGRG